MKDGPEAWNQWWQSLGPEHRKQIDLSGAEFKDLDLRSIKLAHADLAYCNFTGSDLGHADLSNANLDHAQMDNALLNHSNFQGASLQHTRFTGADVFDTNMREANLQSANLADVQGALLPAQLAGTDLTRAKLPNSLEQFYEKMGSVNQISDSAKKLFLGLLAGCFYCWVTIGTTTDVDLITNRASSPLPIIQAAIPIANFYIVAPFILLGIYFYVHFYLQKLWEELALLPAIFPDGRTLYASTDPWLMNDLVRAHFPKLKGNRSLISYFQQSMSIMLAWWLVPITTFLLWYRYLVRHDKFGTVALGLLFLVSTTFASHSHHLAKKTLWDREPTSGNLSLIVFCLMSAVIAPWIFHVDFFNGRHANLDGADVSVKPANWAEEKTDAELAQVKGADLSHQNLRLVSANGAFFATARLYQTDLSQASLAFADFRQAKFWDPTLHVSRHVSSGARLDQAILVSANLKGAILDHASMVYALADAADLSNASLAYADLQRAHLELTNLTGANLTNVDLRSANLTRANLTNADLTSGQLDGAELTYANLRGTKGITPEALKKCYDWQKAFFSAAMLDKLGLPPDHNDALNQYQESKTMEPFDSWQVK